MTYRSPRLRQRPDEVPHQGIPGHVYLFEACDIIGKQMFPTEWNGDELLARSLDEIGDALQAPYRPQLLLGNDDGLTDYEAITGLSIWSVDQPNGETRSFSSPNDALSDWERVVPEAKALAETERAARVRFQTVRDFLLAWLRSDGTAFVYYPKTGTHAQLPTEFWRRRDAWHFFEMGDRQYQWENPNEYVPEVPLPPNAVPVSVIEHLIAQDSPLLREAMASAEAKRERNSGNIIVRADELPCGEMDGANRSLASAESAATRALAEHLRTNRDMKKQDAEKLCQPFKISKNGFRYRVWPNAREKAGLEAKASAGPKKRA